ncbi:TonB-dependent receptor [Hymenobacter busanensis]|uniref:TonB-dependent receptor n=1 Tax=Hymenobacter busanensis TaxID=2607656 RepID=A0A7L4ZZN9_9BACT|nr:TonB-dependent receptor [Hymenobacter busanensis]KAA9331589.1 TonB-dependent receptor [Hymenobacter busanensis]QHJ08741.1 TonB-dependent receptor plug domain-containing protein [Hymenobacter busanensis]
MKIIRNLGLAAGLLLAAAPARSQQQARPEPRAVAGKATLSGYLRDAATGEPLVGASVFVKALGIGVNTDEKGFYALDLPTGPHTVTFQIIGYEPVNQPLNLTGDLTRSIRLSAARVQTQEVVVAGRRAEDNVKKTEMSVNRLDMKTVKLMPALLGEVDVVRSIQLLPGVTTVGEGASGFNVRGGGVDQNLILMDEIPVYNVSHLFGFFSAFNPDAVQDMTLYKGGIPARYGGRLSSLLDVKMRDGHQAERLAINGGIGLISSRLAVEAPLIKDRTSVALSARRSYGDLALKLIPEQRKNQAYFYDLNLKLSHRLSARDQLTVTGYRGRDVFNFADVFKNDWGNTGASARWTHQFSPRLFATFSGVIGQYDYGLGVPKGTQAFEWTSRLRNYTGKADFSYQLNAANTLSAGVSGTRYRFEPATVKPLNAESIFVSLKVDDQQAGEYAAYLDNEQTLSPRLQVQYGLRLSVFDFLGSGTAISDYVGAAGQRKDPANTRTAKNGSVVKRYANLEPRASLRYTLSETSSLKASYNRTTQYIHLISNTTAASPLDVWTPSTNNIRPERGDQVAVGYFRNFRGGVYEASAEVFGKTMSNQIDYVNGANTLLNKNLEGELLYGDGRAYGAEFFVKRSQGKLTGWVSYTLSRSERQIRGINADRWYPNKYDKTHNLSVVGMYQLSPRLTVSSNFAYGTGVATTFPNARFVYDGLVVPVVGGDARNNYRVPAYHRLDLGATLKNRPRPDSRWQSEWVFSVYNVYNRRNPYGIYFRQNEDNPRQTEAVRLSVFGSVIPSVSYNFNF